MSEKFDEPGGEGNLFRQHCFTSTAMQEKSSKTERPIASHYDQFCRGTVVKTHVKTNCFLLTVYCLDCLVPKFKQS